MTLLPFIVLAAFAAGSRPNESDLPQVLSAREIAVKQFASTLAMADLASGKCADILINMPMLDALRDQLGMTSDDRAALKLETNMAREILAEAFHKAPNPQAWCDAAYRMYGPEGQLIRGFMLRSGRAPVP